MKIQTKIGLLILSIVLLLSFVSLVSGDTLVELKYSNNTYYSVLGIEGKEDYYKITSDKHFTGVPKFLLWGVRDPNSVNCTFFINVYEFYEKSIVNNTEVVNATILQEIEVKIETRGFQKDVEINDYGDQEVFIRVGVIGGGDNPSEIFQFWFLTSWDYQTVTKTNLELFLEYNVLNWFVVGFVAIIAFSIVCGFVYGAGYVPKPGQKPVVSTIWIGAGLFLIMFGFTIRPPDMVLFSVGWGILWMFVFTLIGTSSFFSSVQKLLFDDLIGEQTKLIYTKKIKDKIVLINPLSYLDAIFRCFGIYQELPVERYMRSLIGNIDFRVYAEHVVLPHRSYKLNKSVNSLIGLLVTIGITSAIVGLFIPEEFIPIGILIVFVGCIGLYGLLFLEKKEIKFSANFLDRTGVKLTAEHLAQDYRKLEIQLLKIREETSLMIKMREKYLTLLTSKSKLRRIIRFIRRKTYIKIINILNPEITNLMTFNTFMDIRLRDIAKIINDLQKVREDPEEYNRQKAKIYEAGRKISSLVEEIAILNEERIQGGTEVVKEYLQRWSKQMRGEFDHKKEVQILQKQRKEIEEGNKE